MRRLGLVATVAGAMLAGCASTPLAPPPAPAVVAFPWPEPPVAQQGLAVHLVWIGPADLDLLVTDPDGVTYSADRPGDVVVGDVACETDARRTDGIETARWAAPAPGRYRVGIDFPAACGDVDSVAYRVLVDVAGRRRVVDGTAKLLHRAPSVVEVTVP